MTVVLLVVVVLVVVVIVVVVAVVAVLLKVLVKLSNSFFVYHKDENMEKLARKNLLFTPY